MIEKLKSYNQKSYPFNKKLINIKKTPKRITW